MLLSPHTCSEFPQLKFLMKRIWKQLLPLLCIITATIVVSLLLYQKVMAHEEANCWTTLEDTAESINKEITMKFEDEIIKLHLTASILIQEDKLAATQIGSLSLSEFQETSIFTRMDVLYPNHTMLLDISTNEVVQTSLSFEELSAKGEHISQRMTDKLTGKESIYYYFPLVKDNETLAILIGVIDCNRLTEFFHPALYNDQASFCIIDSSNGDYLMDSWHTELGNAYDTPDRKRLKGYEDINLKEEHQNRNTGVIAFVSKSTGKNLYMYYTPMPLFNWTVMIFAQEEVIFKSLLYLHKVLLLAGFVEACLLVFYFSWNLFTVRKLEKSKLKIERQQEQLSYISWQDMLTGLYNRNKYIQVLDSYTGKLLSKIGVVYIDLNGLKRINDTQSHAAGDMYIRNAALEIAKVFPQAAYRIGGDEFVVLAMDIPEQEFLQKVIILKEQMDAAQVSTSCGFLWQESCNNLNTMLNEADKCMYEEKQEYYKQRDSHAI